MKSIIIITLLALASCRKCEPPCRAYTCTTVYTFNGRGTAITDTTGCLTRREITLRMDAAYISNDSVHREMTCK